MSSNGLTASRWATVDVASVAAVPRAGLASSQWADQTATATSDSTSTSNNSTSNEYEDPAAVMWLSWVRDSIDRIPPSELNSYFDNPTLLFNLVPLPAPVNKNMRTALTAIWGFKGKADAQLTAELTTYLESFSPTALKIMDDQLATYLGRLIEDEEESGVPYDGKYGRECGLWMERLRMRDVRGELAEFA